MEAILLAFAGLFVLLALGVPLGFGMGIVGTLGFAWISGWSPALGMVGLTTVNLVQNYTLSVLPLFVLMGALFAHSRMADELYAGANAFVGHRPGGLAMATILACGGFSAVSGSAMACAATMTRVSVPTMRRHGYRPAFAAGTVASGSTLDILIPPSTPMVLYAIITEVDLGRLMAAGLLPGLLTVALYLGTIAAVAVLWPQLAPAGSRTAWPERWRALRGVWPMMALFAGVLGGIYAGIFTPTEAAGIGAFGAFAIAVARRRLRFAPFIASLAETTRITAVLFVVLMGALMFANFITVAGGATMLEGWIGGFGLSPTGLILMMLAVYLLLGCILESTALMLLTIPIFFPLAVGGGIDPIWFGIFVVIMGGIGAVTPPVGILLFVVRTMVPDVGIAALSRAVLPYLAADGIRMALLIAFPGIVLWLPGLMR